MDVVSRIGYPEQSIVSMRKLIFGNELVLIESSIALDHGFTYRSGALFLKNIVCNIL
jgi:hypothetical protein